MGQNTRSAGTAVEAAGNLLGVAVMCIEDAEVWIEAVDC